MVDLLHIPKVYLYNDVYYDTSLTIVKHPLLNGVGNNAIYRITYNQSEILKILI